MEEKKEESADSGAKNCGAAFGEAVAAAAINEMKQEEQPKTGAMAFLAKCKREGKHPIEVVKRVADHYGIKVSSDAPEDEGKRKIYFLLKEVVRQYVEITMCVFKSVVDDGEDGDDGEGDEFPNFLSNVFGYAFTW